MLRTARRLALCVVFALGSASSAHADWLFTPFFGLSFNGTTTIIDLEDGAGKLHWNFGGAVTQLGRGPVGFEGLFSYTPHFFESDEVTALASSHALSLVGNVVIATPLKWSEYGLRPFISAGIGLTQVEQKNLVNVFPVDETFFAYNVGGGAIGFITDRTGLRFDLRYFRIHPREDDKGIAFSDTVRLDYWTVTIGVVFKY